MPAKKVGQTLGSSGKASGDRQSVESLLVGRSPQIEQLRRRIATFANSAHPVLIEGESGTGKELVARNIHGFGRYRGRPFVAVDCGAIVPTLIESELFGHVRGAFTGAVNSNIGLIAKAENGTLFLDEIGDLPSNLQAKLLRVLQEKEIRPVGSSVSRPVNVRVLAATNSDLGAAVEQGSFRRDLYFRLNVMYLRLPPLRERQLDIPLLVSHFLQRLSQAEGVKRTITDEALQRMLAYHWPGNVRELEHCLEHASVVSSGPVLEEADLPAAVRNAGPAGTAVTPAAGIVSLDHLQKQAILNAIERTGGNKLMAARLLGIGKTTLYRKLREWRAQTANSSSPGRRGRNK